MKYLHLKLLYSKFQYIENDRNFICNETAKTVINMQDTENLCGTFCYNVDNTFLEFYIVRVPKYESFVWKKYKS